MLIQQPSDLRVIVAGSVAWNDVTAIRRELSRLPPGSTVIHGDCAGADALAGTVARDLGLRVEAMEKNEADRATWPNAAWMGLNERMLASGAGLVLAFHPMIESSRGSKHLVVLAQRAGVQVRVFTG